MIALEIIATIALAAGVARVLYLFEKGEPMKIRLDTIDVSPFERRAIAEAFGDSELASRETIRQFAQITLDAEIDTAVADYVERLKERGEWVVDRAVTK